MCNFDELIWVITGILLACVAVVASSALGLALLPGPWHFAAAAAGLAAATVAFGLSFVLHSKVQAYHECRNREQGTSRCRYAWPDGIAKAVVAAATAMIAGSVAAWVTGYGGYGTAIFFALVIIALLTALLAALLLYRQCRDEEARSVTGGTNVPGVVDTPVGIGPPGAGGGLL